MKTASCETCCFQLNPSFRTGEIRLRRMKSLRNEIRCGGLRTDLISPSVKRLISSEDAFRRFHCGKAAISLNEAATLMKEWRIAERGGDFASPGGLCRRLH